MISRRLIRIKVFKVLFSSIGSGSDSFLAAEKELLLSCDKTLELYYFMMDLPSALKFVAEQKIEAGLKKFHPTQDEASPNYKFVNNSLIEKLENDKEIKGFCSKKGLHWRDYLPFVKKLYKTIQEKDYFKSYMDSPSNLFEEDLRLISTIFEKELEDSAELESILEDSNLYWTDDLGYVLNIIIKKLSTFLKEGGDFEHPRVFIKDEDKDYAIRLLNVSMIRYSEYTELMSQYVLNWETDRLASTDIALIVMGIAEAVSFPNIPLKVTINEYVELSKYYSTANSKVFVNGMLDKILLALKEQGKIEKSGRGLVGSID
jgi:N utilization substance protein B